MSQLDVRLANRQASIGIVIAYHEYQEVLFITSSECGVLLGGGKRSKNESVQALEELERMNSIGENTPFF